MERARRTPRALPLHASRTAPRLGPLRRVQGLGLGGERAPALRGGHECSVVAAGGVCSPTRTAVRPRDLTAAAAATARCATRCVCSMSMDAIVNIVRLDLPMRRGESVRARQRDDLHGVREHVARTQEWGVHSRRRKRLRKPVF